nr:PREDICTED: uncharacterized protein LOC109634805 [Paralichthys olivaceus]
MECNNGQRNPSMRKQPSSQRAQTGSLQTTEYCERFIDPRSYKTLAFTAPQADPFHPLAGTKYMPMTTLRKKYIHCKRMKVPPKAPTPFLPPEARKPSSPPESQETPMPSSPPEDPEPSWLPETPDSSASRFITTHTSDFVVHPLQPRESPLKRPCAISHNLI